MILLTWMFLSERSVTAYTRGKQTFNQKNKRLLSGNAIWLKRIPVYAVSIILTETA